MAEPKSIGDASGRTWAIGDIHGCLDALRAVIDFADIRPNDVIVTLGDYVDRGPDTKGVIDELITLGSTHTLVSLKGNHEIMMLRACEDSVERSRWLDHGGMATLMSYGVRGDGGAGGVLDDVPNRHWDFLEGLVDYHENETHFFVHANAYPDVPLDRQPEYMLFWERFDNQPRHQSQKTMVCGHASQKSGVPLRGDAGICIDTNVARGGWLTCLCCETGEIVQADARGEVRTLFPDEVRTFGD